LGLVVWDDWGISTKILVDYVGKIKLGHVKTITKVILIIRRDPPNAIHLLPMLINEGGDSVWGYSIRPLA